MIESVINVGVIGAAGRMGREVVHALLADGMLAPVAALDMAAVGADWGALAGAGEIGVAICGDLSAFLDSNPQVVIDVSAGDAVSVNAPRVLARGIPMVIGTTGIASESLDSFDSIARKNNVCCLVVPNFSIGANVMISLARKAAPYFASAEIIERHHSGKKDAPSGTALFTASEIASANPKLAAAATGHEVLPGARGGEQGEIRVHSVRLPGILAEQTVVFGGPGEVLEITHRTVSRECYMPGVVCAIKHVLNAEPGLLVGLDRVLGLARE